MNRRNWMLSALGALALPQPSLALAAAYPNRPIRMIVPFLAGSSPDLFARTIGAELSTRLRQPVVIENMPGAGGMIGATALKRAAPDGYTIGLLANTHLINAYMYRTRPYDVATDFTPIAMFSGGASVVVVKASSPVHSLPDLAQRLRREPGAFNYASSGKGSIAHLAAEALLHLRGLNAVHIAYKGGPEIIPAIVNEQVQFGIPVLSSALPYVRNGQLRALAVTTAARSPLLPDVPTMAEALPPGYVIDNWGGLFAPPKLPSDLLRTLFAQVHAVVAGGGLDAHAQKNGAEIRLSESPAEFANFLRADSERYGKWMRNFGMGNGND